MTIASHGRLRDNHGADRADHGDRRHGGHLGVARHPQPGAVVADHRADTWTVEHPLLEAWARAREAGGGDDEEHGGRQAGDDDADRADGHGDPAECEPQPAQHGPSVAAFSRGMLLQIEQCPLDVQPASVATK